MEDPLKRLIERRHPLYEERLPHWDFLEATFDGGRQWFSDNIFRYLKEGEQEFKDRIARAYRFNHTREVVGLVGKYLFKMPISRREEDAPESVKRFWKKATRNGLDINAYARRVEQLTSIYGRIWVVVDNTLKKTPEGAIPIATKADEKKGNVQIFSYAMRPQAALDMSFDDAGKMNWILFHEVKRDDEDPIESSGKLVNRFRLWTRTGWRLFEEKKGPGRRVMVVQIDAGEHDLGVVPVFAADHTISEEEYTSNGLIEDIAYLDRAVANYLSNLDAIIQDQTFSQLAMPSQGIPKGEDGKDKLMEIGTKRLFSYDGEAGQIPFYLSPDVKQAELILKAILKIINEIYHSVGLSGERTKDDNGGGADNSSGVAKGYDFERTNSLLTAKGDAMERFENSLCQLVALWAGEDCPEDLVKYPESYDTRGLYDEFEIGARLTLLNAPEGMRREQMRLLLDKLFPALDDETRKELETELNKWPPEELMLAGLGLPTGTGGSPVKAAGVQKTAKQMAS